MGEIKMARERGVNARNAISYTERRLLNLLSTSNSRYKDINKVSVESTSKGNWRLYYDNKDTGLTVGRSQLDEYELLDQGLIRRR